MLSDYIMSTSSPYKQNKNKKFHVKKKRYRKKRFRCSSLYPDPSCIASLPRGSLGLRCGIVLSPSQPLLLMISKGEGRWGKHTIDGSISRLRDSTSIRVQNNSTKYQIHDVDLCQHALDGASQMTGGHNGQGKAK